MMKTLLLWAITLSVMAQFPDVGEIHTVMPDVIKWRGHNNRVYKVQWRQSLVEGEWEDVGERTEWFEHHHPDGFYRVVETPDVAIVVWNSGTSNMTWTADCETLPLELINTNIAPNGGVGWIIVRATNAPVGDHIVNVYGNGAWKQATIQSR